MRPVKLRLMLLLAVTVALTAVSVAVARPTGRRAAAAHCSSVRLNRFLRPSANGLFGAFSLTARGAGCSQARTIASAYVHDSGAVDSPKHRTTRLSGWTCTWHDNDEVAQQVSVTCTKSAARITFADRIPSG
jgi:hypothetical protein